MCTRFLACPLCSQPSFSTLDALRTGLVNVATRPLVCPVCNEVLLGIDKLTIHLFGHTMDASYIQNNETVRAIDMYNVNSISNSSDTLNTFQQWNINKGEPANKSATVTTQLIKDPSSHQIKNLQEVILLQSVQNHSQSSNMQLFKQNEKQAVDNHGNIQDLITKTSKLNCISEYYGDKKSNIQQTDEKSVFEFQSNWIQPVSIENKCVISNNGSKPCENIQSDMEKPTINVIVGNEFLNFQSLPCVQLNCVETSKEFVQNSYSIQSPKENTLKETDGNNSIMVVESNQPQLLRSSNFDETAEKEKADNCDVCGFYFPDHNILNLHKKLVHLVVAEKEGVSKPEEIFRNYPCHLCCKVFKMKGSLMIHMRVAHSGHDTGFLSKNGQLTFTCNDDGYKCPTCGKNFKKEQHVVQHLKTHEGKQWECDVCCKLFTTKYFLKKHKRLHSGEMPYKCNICDKTFTFQQSYHKHRLYHKDDKPHTCSTCNRSFKELSTLHNHERIHTGEKPFACETCGKCFRQRVSYLVHRRIHTGVMPYKCTLCGKFFRYKVSQRTHKCPVQQQTAKAGSECNDSSISTSDTMSGLFTMRTAESNCLVTSSRIESSHNDEQHPVESSSVSFNTSNVINGIETSSLVRYSENIQSTLETINEESLKQLLSDIK